MHILHTVSIMFKLYKLYLHTYLLQESSQIGIPWFLWVKVHHDTKHSFYLLMPVFSHSLPLTFPTEKYNTNTIEYT